MDHVSRVRGIGVQVVRECQERLSQGHASAARQSRVEVVAKPVDGVNRPAEVL